MEQCGAKCPEAEEIKDIVTCAICLEIFENPRILPCSHTYCHMCLYALCEGSSVTEHTRCPQCRKLSIPPLAMLDQLPGHLLADQLADLIREREGIVETNGRFFNFKVSYVIWGNRYFENINECFHRIFFVVNIVAIFLASLDGMHSHVVL